MEQKDPSRLVLPSNSIKKPTNPTEQVAPEPVVMQKITGGEVKIKKKGFLRRLASKVLADDAQNIKQFIVSDTIIPAIRNLIYDMAVGALDMSLFGGPSSSGRLGRSKNRNKSYVSYQGYYDSRQDRPSARRNREESKDRGRISLEDIVFESRGEAENVLTAMVDVIDLYQQVTVANLYELVGVTGEFTDNRYGWTNLSSANVRRARDGYIIELPKPVVLD